MKKNKWNSKSNIIFFGCVNITFILSSDIYKKILDYHINNRTCVYVEMSSNLINGKIIFQEDKNVSIEYKDRHNSLIIKGPREYFELGISIYYLAEYLAECLQAEYTNSLIIHGAAVYSKELDESILILGEKGAGKTTIALRLCKELGFNLVGNDLVRVGIDSRNKLFTKEGSQWFNIRKTAQKADTYLNKTLRLKFSCDETNMWNNKIKVFPKELDIKVHFNKARISNIMYIKIDRFQENCTSNIWGGIYRNLILHEKVGRHISGQATPFQTDDGRYLGSLPLIKYDKNIKIRDKIVKNMEYEGVNEVFAQNSDELLEWIKEKIL